MQSASAGLEPAAVMTLEAFADTIIPGEKRFPEDAAVAGAASGGGAVTAGALDLLAMPATGMSDFLPGRAQALDGHALGYAAELGRPAGPGLPPFVGLTFAERTALVVRLTAPEHPERELWVGLVLFSNMAFDSAAHLHTAEALAAGHPGLTMMGFTPPGADGLWRFPDFSYRRELAPRHPGTTSSGSPA